MNETQQQEANEYAAVVLSLRNDVDELARRLDLIHDWLSDRYPSNCMPPNESELDLFLREVKEARDWWME